MFGKCATTLVATMALLPGPALADAPDPVTGKITSYTYGEDAFNSYTSWSGGWLWTWQFSAQHIGVSPAPVAGQTFYLHAHSAVIAPTAVTGNVLLLINQDAGGLPLRYAPTSEKPLLCSRAQFDPVISVTPAECPASVTVQSGQFVVSKLEPLVPGFGFDVLLPVAVDSAATGTAAMTAMWATTDVTLSNLNVLATVPVTVAAAPAPPSPPQPTTPAPGTTRQLPKKLRKYKRVKSLTPKVCTVKSRTVVTVGTGTCRLKGTRWKGHTPKVVSIQM